VQRVETVHLNIERLPVKSDSFPRLLVIVIFKIPGRQKRRSTCAGVARNTEDEPASVAR
jgi:hypothetical protein